MVRRAADTATMNQSFSSKELARHMRLTRGETLAETLVGLLITALSLVMLSSAIATATRITAEKTIVMAGTFNQSTKDLMPSPDATDGSSTVQVSGPESSTDVFSGVSGTVYVKWKESDLPGSRKGVTYVVTSTPVSDPEPGGEG